jgi:hypothetical protein
VEPYLLALRESMRKNGLAVLAAAALLLSGAAVSWGASGVVTYADGEVTVSRGGARADAVPGTAVGEGDAVSTGSDSVAVIRLPDGSEVKLREKTTLAMDSLEGSAKLSLRSGGVFSRVTRQLAGKYTVTAGRAVAGVRGTEFFVAYGKTVDAQPDVWLCVNSGTVEVSVPETGQSVLVPQGTGINIIAGSRITAPRSFPWTRGLNWNTDPASGKVADRTNLEQAYSDLLDQDYE